MEERGTLIEELRVVRSQLQQAIAAAVHLDEKLCGPKPSGESSPKDIGESVMTVVGDIKRQALSLNQLLGAHHSVLGNFDRNPEKASMAVAGAQSRY